MLWESVGVRDGPSGAWPPPCTTRPWRWPGWVTAATALFKGTLGTVIAVTPPARLGEALAGYFLSGYAGLSIPVIAVGVTLQSVTPRGTLLAFATAVTIAILAASPVLLGKSHPAATSGTASTATVPAREGI